MKIKILSIAERKCKQRGRTPIMLFDMGNGRMYYNNMIMLCIAGYL